MDVTVIADIQKHHDPDVVFLMETHLDEGPTDCLKRRLMKDHKEVVKSDGRKVVCFFYGKKR
jgi:hypothetical protein